MTIKLIVLKSGVAYDMSELVKDIRWSGRKSSATRSISVSLLDDDTNSRPRAAIDVENGEQCIFQWKGKELFRGMFMKQEQSNQKMMTLTAYDQGIYLANNKDSFNYSNQKASDIFIDCCKRFQIPYDEVADTSYKIPELPKPKTTAYDVICDALSLTYKTTGVRYYPMSINGKMRLLERRKNVLQWVIETGINLESYQASKSIENITTRVKLISDEGKILAQAINAEVEKKIGVFQDVSQPDDKLNTAQLNEQAKTTLDENSSPQKTLTINALGVPDVITGVGVYVVIKELNISKTYYVEEDSHSFQGNQHTMRLKLTEAGDISTEQKTEDSSNGDIKVNDIVQFSGGYHYVSSTAGSPTGGERKAGQAKCTKIATGAAHQYHLIGGAYSDVGGNSNVYGWVDAGKVSKK